MSPHSITSTFDPRATPAESVYHLSLLVMAVCTTIFLVVAGLLAYTVLRFRRKAGDVREPAQIYGSNQMEIAWTIIPILIVFVLVMVTARVVGAVQNRRASKDAVHVTGWEIRYPDLEVVTANELHAPVNTTTQPRETVLRLTKKKPSQRNYSLLVRHLA